MATGRDRLLRARRHRTVRVHQMRRGAPQPRGIGRTALMSTPSLARTPIVAFMPPSPLDILILEPGVLLRSASGAPRLPALRCQASVCLSQPGGIISTRRRHCAEPVAGERQTRSERAPDRLPQTRVPALAGLLRRSLVRHGRPRAVLRELTGSTWPFLAPRRAGNLVAGTAVPTAHEPNHPHLPTQRSAPTTDSASARRAYASSRRPTLVCRW